MPAKKTTILAADDDPLLLRQVLRNLQLEGYEVLAASDGQQALEQIEQRLPDLVLLDVMMPGLDGFSVCQRVRQFSSVPIIIVTARGLDEDKKRGLDLGADDYLTKPFSVDELLARVRAVLRRAQFISKESTQGSRMPITIGDLTIDFAEHAVTMGSEEVPLTTTEYRLLAYLAQNAGRVVTEDLLLEHVWGTEYLVESHMLQANINRLRRKIEVDPAQPRNILTKVGVGYSLTAQPRVSTASSALDIRNPYIAGSPVTGTRMFFGRQDVFDFVHRNLIGQHRDNVIVLYGQRRTGKTSVLYQMRSHFDTHYLCVFVDLHSLELEGIGGFLWELTQHIRRGLYRDYQIELPSPNRDDFMKDPRVFFEDEFLNRVWSACGDRHVLLMIDEAIRLREQVQAGKLEHEIFEYMRHLMQHYERLNFIFSLGSGLEEMEKDYAFLFNVGLYKKISFLDRDAANALMTQPVEEYYQIEPTALDRIFQITSGHPYYTQLLCHSLFNWWTHRRVKYIEAQHIDEVLDEVVELGSAVLKHVWEESTAAEKAIMASMSALIDEGNHPSGIKAINRAWVGCDVVIPKGETAKAIHNLIARDIIVGQGEYVFTVDLQRLWVQKHRRIEWVKEEITDAIREWSSTSEAKLRRIPRRRALIGMGIGGLGLIVTGGGFLLHQLTSRSQPRSSSSYPSNMLTVYRNHVDKVVGVAWSPDGTRIASASWDSTVQVWNAATGERLYTYYGHDNRVICVCWSPDGTRIASGSDDRTVHVWDPSNGLPLFIYVNHRDSVHSVAWSPDSGWIASASNDHTVHIWRALNGGLYGSNVLLLNSRSFVWTVGWSPDFTRIAFGSSDSTIQVWDPRKHKILVDYRGHSGLVHSLDWSSASSRIVSGSDDNTAQVWDAQDGTRLVTYSGHSDKVWAVAWSPDASRVASSGYDRTVQVWDAQNGSHLSTYKGHSDGVGAVAWSPDGKKIASGSYDRTVQVWRARM